MSIRINAFVLTLAACGAAPDQDTGLVSVGTEVNEKAPPCYGGSMIWDSAGKFAGCFYSYWDSTTASMCGGATAFTPSKDGDCWVCATGSAATSVAAGSWSGLTVGSSPADFRCLACVDPPSDIEGWWSFDSTSTPGADISVNGNDGTISGATQVSGKSSWALSFDGVNDTVQIPDDSTLDIGTGSLSFDAWVKISSATDVGGTRVLLDKRSVSGTKYTGYHVFLHSGALAIQLADGSGTSGWTNYICSYKVPTDGKWHLVAITVERVTSGVITFYGVECPRAR